MHESLYTYPLVESVHVWTLAVFVGLAAVLDLRLVGLALRQVPVTELAQRLTPWLVGGFAVMIVSGAMLFYAIPVRTLSERVVPRQDDLPDPWPGLNAWLFHSGVYRSVASWDLAAVPPPGRAGGRDSRSCFG